MYTHEQVKLLSNLLCHAKENIPYYFEILINTDINESTAIDALRTIPIISKRDYRLNYKNLIDIQYDWKDIKNVFDISDKSFNRDHVYIVNGKKLIAEYTSGTTGAPFVTVKTEEERFSLGMSLWKLRKMHGNTDPQKMFLFMHTSLGAYPFPFAASNSFDQNLKELEYLSQSEHEWWHIFPSMLEGYAYWTRKKQIEFKNLVGIECNGAYISDQERSSYEEIFQCKLVNNYGTRELWNIAYENINHTLTINSDVLFELVDENSQLIEENNKIGYVVVTSLRVRTMPFIRYYLGDMAYYSDYIGADGKKNRGITIVPGRHMISGTDEYGNRFFREIAIDLIQSFNLKMIKSVFVKEISPGNFVVNFAGCNENKGLAEEKFLECLSLYKRVDSSNWKIQFTFDDIINNKSIFVSLVK